MTKLMDETGKKYGVLTVIKRAPQKKRQSTRWLCRCSVCGDEVVVIGWNLRKFKYARCKHRRLDYGDYKDHPLYHIWSNMIYRCRVNTVANRYYSGRGIKVCNRWHSLASFIEDMGERPEGMTLDRIDNDGNYEPGNCRWATRTEQAENRRSNKMITFNGESLCMSAWARRIGISRQGLWHRLSIGWPIEKALSKKVLS